MTTQKQHIDLGIRIGLHSGPVTAGILRGEKSRFQLFGDTVNMCARMESAGKTNRIHISQQTADLLIIAGKSSWIEVNHDSTFEDLETYWLIVKHRRGFPATESDRGSSGGQSIGDPQETDPFDYDNESTDEMNIDFNSSSHNTSFANNTGEIQSIRNNPSYDKMKRLVDWNAEMLLRLLKQIIAYRRATSVRRTHHPKDFFFRRGSNEVSTCLDVSENVSADFGADDTVIDEVVEIIDMPEFDERITPDCLDPNSVELDNSIRGEVRAFVSMIAALYQQNPFHNYEHGTFFSLCLNCS
jgi:Adenylate and Guanylate cyclase catalytic domain